MGGFCIDSPAPIRWARQSLNDPERDGLFADLPTGDKTVEQAVWTAHVPTELTMPAALAEQINAEKSGTTQALREGGIGHVLCYGGKGREKRPFLTD